MVNKYRAEVIIEIDDDEKIMRFDLGAIAELEGMYDKSILEILGADKKMVQFRAIVDAVYVGLKNKGNRKLTRANVLNMLDPSKMGEYGELVTKGIMSAMGQTAPEEGAEDPLDGKKGESEPASTGTNSKPLPSPSASASASGI